MNAQESLTRGRSSRFSLIYRRTAPPGCTLDPFRYPKPQMRLAKPKIVSFDCASTLLATDYSPEGFAMKSARLAGLTPAPGAEEAYRVLFTPRAAEYAALNHTGDQKALGAFWLDITREWAAGTGLTGHETRILEAAEKLLYSPEHRYFDLYPDVIPCLERLKTDGYRLIVLSNWDYTLHRVLACAGLAPYFERIFASLENGIEKPDPRFFRIAEEEMRAAPEDFLHIGDRLDDDLEGALNAGWRALLVDRTLERDDLPRIAGFDSLPEVFSSL